MSELRSFGCIQKPLPVIGQGTWNMETDGHSRSVRAIQKGIDAGLTHIDTAEMYGDGAVESIVGEAIKGPM